MSDTVSKILVVECRPAQRTRLLEMLDQLNLPYTTVVGPAPALQQIAGEAPLALITAPQLPNLSGEALVALARGLRPRLECFIVDQPDQDRGLLENLARRLRSTTAPGGTPFRPPRGGVA